MKRVMHSLVGYDRVTERVAEEFDVPHNVIPAARELARVPADDPDAVMCYPLDPRQAQDLAAILNATIDTGHCDYYLEGFASGEMPYQFADDAEFRLDSSESSTPARPKHSVWLHNDATRHHVKVTVARSDLDDYANKHGHGGHRAAIDLLNVRIKDRVQETVNRAMDEGRASKGCLELNSRDLGAILDE